MNLTFFKRAINEISHETICEFAALVAKYQKFIILGNGGSSAIASHISQDYTKALKKRAITFSDPSRLTCYINDYGMKKAYQQFVKEFADAETLVILISSSGESKNIRNAAHQCYYNDIPYIILTGFKQNNSLRTLYGHGRKDSLAGKTALMDIWVDSEEYGIVEITHETILHSVC